MSRSRFRLIYFPPGSGNVKVEFMSDANKASKEDAIARATQLVDQGVYEVEILELVHIVGRSLRSTPLTWEK